MIETLLIDGGVRLKGEVSVSGGKNAAVAIIPAALLADSPSTIENLPDIDDVYCLRDILIWLGADVTFEHGVMSIDPRGITRNDPPYELVRKMRASYYLVPVLLGRMGSSCVPMPGGCDIGNRPIDQTIKGLTSLGADVDLSGGVIRAQVTDHFEGTEVFLDFPSVGATINTMLTAVCAKGATTIHNAAKEPHIVDTANFLSSMGAWVKGAGTDVIRIRGGRPLHGSNYAVIPDQIETGTLMIAAAATRGDVMIRGAIPTHMESLTAKLLEMGVHVNEADDRIRVRADGKLRPINIKTQVYPGFPTDLQQPMTAMLDKGMSLEEIISAVLDGFEVDFLQTEEIGYRCACSREKVERALISLGKTELSKMIAEQEKSEVTCQFCDKIYRFSRDQLQELLTHAAEKK